MNTTRRKLIKAAGLAVPAASAKVDHDDIEPAALLSLMAKRQTVRRYKSDPVPDEHLMQILDAARRVPTCMNQQPWRFLVVRDRAKIEQMKKRTLALLDKVFTDYAAKNKEVKPCEVEKKKADSVRFTEGYFSAPVYVAVLVDAEAPCKTFAVEHDGPLAVGYLMLAARAFGYGTAYLTHGIPEDVTRDVLNIPARYKRICITPIGVPDGWPKKPPKRKLEEMIAYETMEGQVPQKEIPYNP